MDCITERLPHAFLLFPAGTALYGNVVESKVIDGELITFVCFRLHIVRVMVPVHLLSIKSRPIKLTPAWNTFSTSIHYRRFGNDPGLNLSVGLPESLFVLQWWYMIIVLM